MRGPGGIIHTKFVLGTRVWRVSWTSPKRQDPCPFCAGVGRICGTDGSSERCPKCRGAGSKTVWLPRCYSVGDRPLTLGEVQVRERAEYREGPESEFDNFGWQEAKREERYMCRETGIGSGSLHDADDLFATREEAQADADRRNAKAIRGEG